MAPSSFGFLSSPGSHPESLGLHPGSFSSVNWGNPLGRLASCYRGPVESRSDHGSILGRVGYQGHGPTHVFVNQQFAPKSRCASLDSTPVSYADDSGTDIDPIALAAATSYWPPDHDDHSTADQQPQFESINNAPLTNSTCPQRRRPMYDVFSKWEASAEHTSVSPLSPNNDSWTTYKDISSRAYGNDGSLPDQSPVFFEHEAFPGAGHLTPPPICSNISRPSYIPVSLPQSWRTSVPPRKPVPSFRPSSPYKPDLPPKPPQYASISARTSLSPSASSPVASSPNVSSPNVSSLVDRNSAEYGDDFWDLTGRRTLQDTDIDLSATLSNGCSNSAVFRDPGLPFQGSDYQACSVLPDARVELEPSEKPSAWGQCRKFGQSLMSRVSTMTGANSERWLGT